MTFEEASKMFARISAGGIAGAEAACNAMASAYQSGVKHELARFPHSAHTRTPSPRGEPPGLISGRLRESVTKTPAAGSGGEYSSWVGPHTVYAVIQEYGGPMTAHREYMSWITDGRRYWKKHVMLPERPYMRPVSRRMSADGQLTEVALTAFGSVIYPLEF